MALRPYQDRALSDVSRAWRAESRSVLLVLPTGGGKTAIGCEAVRRAVARGRRVLWLAHRWELIDQAAARLTSEGLGGHGLILSGWPQRPGAPVQIASVDTLRNRRPPPADLLVWDEAHHVAADTWRALHAHYAAAYHLGLTATPQRGDGRALGDVFGALVVGATVPELTSLGWLVPCDVEAPAGQERPGHIARDPVDAYLARAAGRKAVLYAASVQDAHEYARRLVAAGVPAAAVEGKTPPDERKYRLRQFAAGDLRVVTNVAVLTEGYDCPSAEVCVVARHVGHAGLWLQMVGRVLRPAPGKTRALVLDLAGNAHAHGLPEEERAYTLDGAGIQRKPAPPLTVCRGCGATRREYPCARCDYRPERDPLRITGRELVPVARPKPAPTPAARRIILERLLRLAAERGYKKGWVYHAFRSKFGGAPTAQELAEASARVAGGGAPGPHGADAGADDTRAPEQDQAEATAQETH